MSNPLSEQYARRRPSIGTFIQLGSAEAAECAGVAGFDFLIVDTEHSPFGLPEVTACCRAALLRGATPLVRICEISRTAVLKALDAGAGGLVVPGVQSAAEVRRLIEYGKYPPLGSRGFCPTRCCAWGYDGSMQEGIAAYLGRANRDTLLLPQCETAGCLAQLEEIVALEGVDGIFVGPFDLSVALGMPGRFEEPAMKEAFARILAVCRRAGKPALIYAPTLEAGRQRLAQGFDGVCCSADLNFMMDAMLAACRGLRAEEGTR